jgi:hypothetical protein
MKSMAFLGRDRRLPGGDAELWIPGSKRPAIVQLLTAPSNARETSTILGIALNPAQHPPSGCATNSLYATLFF